MPRALIFYHFFYPDDVVSARHFSDLATGLADRGWDVVVRPSNRGCRDEQRTYPPVESTHAITIERVWRPRFAQGTTIGRALNALWMLFAWTLSVRGRPPDVLIVGTDPILSVLVAIPWKIFRPKTKIVHWCFDLYPEAAVADGTLKSSSLIARALRPLLGYAYRCCDVLVDIGPCMRELLALYKSAAQVITVTPWALTEPAPKLPIDTVERQAVFGDARLGLMYSGNFGRAHSYREILELAQAVRHKPIRFAFSVRGNRSDELRNAVSAQGENVDLVPFADESKLEARLSAADIHIVTLRGEWTGSVVPSKFFGALAAGRPVLFVGSPESSVARWILQYRVGWVLSDGNRLDIAAELSKLAEHPQTLTQLFLRCHSVYHKHFSRKKVLDSLDDELHRTIRSQPYTGTALMASRVRR